MAVADRRPGRRAAARLDLDAHRSEISDIRPTGTRAVSHRSAIDEEQWTPVAF